MTKTLKTETLIDQDLGCGVHAKLTATTGPLPGTGKVITEHHGWLEAPLTGTRVTITTAADRQFCESDMRAAIEIAQIVVGAARAAITDAIRKAIHDA